MRIQATRRFERDFRRLPRQAKRRIDEAIRLLAENPYLGKVLRGELVGYRSLRVGDYRVIYRINEAREVVLLLSVRHRRAAYRGCK